MTGSIFCGGVGNPYEPLQTPCHPRAQDGLGLAAEHGFFFRRAGSLEWDVRSSTEDMAWQGIVAPLLQAYTESTDGSCVEAKESALVWHYGAADPDFGSLQVRRAFPPSPTP